jgi:hypothetical protein
MSEQSIIDTEPIGSNESPKIDVDQAPNMLPVQGILPGTPRPALTLTEAAAVMGKSVRALERSLIGKWGNKLPDGWQARRIRSNGKEEWRIIPPVGFNIKYKGEKPNNGDQTTKIDLFNGADWNKFGIALTSSAQALVRRYDESKLDRHTIVIDRTDDVEQLLKELAGAQKELAEERRLHIEDLRIMNQLQSSMRLIETNANETGKLKSELIDAQKELVEIRKHYEEYLSLPWWKKIFRKFP